MIEIIVALLVLTALVTPACCIFPKMISEATFQGKNFRVHHNGNTESITSRSFFTFGNCQYNESFQVPISGGSGQGFIIPLSNELSFTNLSLMESSNQTGTVELQSAVPADAFDMFQPIRGTDQETKAFPFKFHNIGDDGSTLRINCEQSKPSELMVMIRDDSKIVVNAKVEFDQSGGQRMELDSSNNLKSETTLKGISKGKSNNHVASFKKASKKGITIHHDKPGGVAVVQVQVRNPANGKMVQRSIVTETRTPPAAVKPMGLLKSEVDEYGDVVIKFQSIEDSNKPLKFDARIGISVDRTNTQKDCVDVSAIVEDHTLVVNNEWLRQCLNRSGLTNQTNGWDVVVLNATVTDPNDGYRVLARLEDTETTGIKNHQRGKRQHLASPPIHTKITKEMREGRKPRDLKQRNLRAQQRPQSPPFQPIRPPQQPPQQKAQKVAQTKSPASLPHRKILVYGYCAKNNPFPTSQFTNFVAFSDPSSPASWSHDTFARKIANFTSDLGGCGCIAHSQGGAACLHLKAYYHSCLDTPNVKGRAIQSVGTPYQGTAFAGTLASLGQVFGSSCGYNTDLTYSGAQSWLSHIPSWARSQVFYYTTSFSRYYCNFASEFVISDPNDGVTEFSADQLVGGNDMGSAKGWCHVAGMRDPAQYLDANRNTAMNAAAQY